ncbi:MAG: ATP-binding protein [Phycisphaeraceae bacterium]|nr:ATP-binding protein [Phycisphaeraceae bacterium]
MPNPDFEKLGVFYLGKEFDLSARRRSESLILYDSKDLCTHAVCVGMTGSGKTGLCLALLEEAAIDGIPSVIIDPKGDLSNLLLTFPSLKADDFRPWINAEDAKKKGVSPDEYAAQQAALWAKGLEEWGQDGARIQRLKDAAEFAIYTPGSSAGLQVSILKSFGAPTPEVIEDAEVFRERVNTVVTSLLGLLGIEADPLKGREHILLSALITRSWSEGQDLELSSLIAQVQNPPIQRVGVMNIESFYPAKERFALAMQINSLLASPGFSRWMEGEALEIGAMIHSPTAKPRCVIFSIAHLPDAERMFFVSLLLNQVLGWMRTQSGTSSLRAILYMDEIAGYFPPTANPPSKRPLLTLMKQGRAFGVGVVLATQNPVDLDYKGLANAGTWFIGRLQTDRDKQRVLDGLEGASTQAGSGFDRAAMDRLLSQLGSRVFLMNNVHDDGPVVFETRWCLSYLRGPLTRTQIKLLSDPARIGDAAVAETESVPTKQTAAASSAARPVLPPEVPQYFLATRASGPVTYVPMLLGLSRIYYSDSKVGVDTEVSASMLVSFEGGPIAIDWDRAQVAELSEADLEREPATPSSFAVPPADVAKPKNFDAWKKSLVDALFRAESIDILICDDLEEVSKPGESERDFRLRLDQAAREARDGAIDKIRAKYAPKAATLEERRRRAEAKVQVQKEQASGAKWNTAISVGSAILGALLGRKTMSAGNVSKAGTAARSASRTMKESADVGRAEEDVAAIDQQIRELEEKVQGEIDAASARVDAATISLERITLKPKKTNITVKAVVLAWAPHTSHGGRLTPAW